MSEWTRKCARSECDTWQRFELGVNSGTWLSVLLCLDDETELLHFCTPWCLNLWSNKFDYPTELIRWETDGGFIPPEVW